MVPPSPSFVVPPSSVVAAAAGVSVDVAAASPFPDFSTCAALFRCSSQANTEVKLAWQGMQKYFLSALLPV